MDIDINHNKDRILKILGNYVSERSGYRELVEMLKRTDFFTAPASTKYHLNVEGGLAAHTLSVYEQMIMQVSIRAKQLGIEFEDIFVDDLLKGDYLVNTALFNEKIKEILESPSADITTIPIAVICHDFHKINHYYKDEKRVKVGSEWKTVDAFFTREDAFVMGDSGTNSVWIANKYIKLTYDEALAIENHMGMHDNGTPLAGSSGAWKKSTLACLLHASDLISTFVLER